MKKKPYHWKPKRVLRLPDLDHAKTAVLSSLGSPESERSYRFAIDDFIAWYCSEPRLACDVGVAPRLRSQTVRTGSLDDGAFAAARGTLGHHRLSRQRWSCANRSDSGVGQGGHRCLANDCEYQYWEAVPMCE